MTLALSDFSGAVFPCGHFQKIAEISSLCDFHYISEGNPSLMHFCLLKCCGFLPDLKNAQATDFQEIEMI